MEMLRKQTLGRLLKCACVFTVIGLAGVAASLSLQGPRRARAEMVGGRWLVELIAVHAEGDLEACQAFVEASKEPFKGSSSDYLKALKGKG